MRFIEVCKFCPCFRPTKFDKLPASGTSAPVLTRALPVDQLGQSQNPHCRHVLHMLVRHSIACHHLSECCAA